VGAGRFLSDSATVVEAHLLLPTAHVVRGIVRAAVDAVQHFPFTPDHDVVLTAALEGDISAICRHALVGDARLTIVTLATGTEASVVAAQLAFAVGFAVAAGEIGTLRADVDAAVSELETRFVTVAQATGGHGPTGTLA